MCRIDVPAIGEIAAFTQLYGGQAIYAMTPVSEQVARGVATRLQARPVSIWDIAAVAGDRQARLALPGRHDDDDDDGEP